MSLLQVDAVRIWTRPRTFKIVDLRAVVNSDQAWLHSRPSLNMGPRGERMVAFHGRVYYAALRPEVGADLRRDNSQTCRTTGGAR